MRDFLLTLIQDVKTSAGVAAYTVGSGVAWGLNFMEGYIATIATLSGVILTWVLIYYNIRKGITERQVAALQIKDLQAKIGMAVEA